jgi:hypothetical protein
LGAARTVVELGLHEKSSPNPTFTPPILRGVLHMVDHENIDGSSRRLKLQAKLIPHGREDRRIVATSRGIGRPLQRDVKATAQSRADPRQRGPWRLKASAPTR